MSHCKESVRHVIVRVGGALLGLTRTGRATHNKSLTTFICRGVKSGACTFEGYLPFAACSQKLLCINNLFLPHTTDLHAHHQRAMR